MCVIYYKGWATIRYSVLQTMATNPTDGKATRSGDSTEHYRRVKANFASIVRSLEANPDAFKSLCRKFREKSWIQKVDVAPDCLLNVVLDRIRLNVKAYDEFIEMLGNVDGLDLIKETIEATKCISKLMPIASSYVL